VRADDAETLAERLGAALSPDGLDLVWPFSAARYDAAVAPVHRLPAVGRADALAILVGNSRALWPPFRAALAAAPERREADHPLDDWVEERVRAAAATLNRACAFAWAHARGGRVIALQRLCELSGLAAIAPCHLNVHPVFGPWIALRAVVVIDAPPPASPRHNPSPCAGCPAPCVPAFAQARERARGAADPLRAAWRDWLAVRDACPVGRAHRYDEAQLLYHYTKDRALLR
jgi:methylmalonic aciduria homocystinuria type C protein